MSNRYDNNMRAQVMGMPQLLRGQYEDLEPKTRLVLPTEEIFSIQEILLTGCGDSFAAALATRHAFEQLVGVPTRAVEAIELARFYDAGRLGAAPLNPLVIAVSNSGGVARVGEAVQRAAKYGAATLGVTGNPQSLLGKSARKVLQLAIPSLPEAPGVGSYMVSVLALLLLAIRFGEVRGRYTMDTAMAYRGELAKQADALEAALPEMDRQVLALAEEWQHLNAYEFSGAGMDYAAAFYGQAKIFEAVGKPAMLVNNEEWAHLNFFLRDNAGTGSVVVCHAGSPATSRVKEQVAYLQQMGRPYVLVGGDDTAARAHTVPLPKTEYWFAAALLQPAPLALLAGYLSAMAGEEYGRGAKDAWAICQGGACVKNSEIQVL